MNDPSLVKTIEQLISDDPLNEYRLLRMVSILLECDQQATQAWRDALQQHVKEHGAVSLETALALLGRCVYRRPGPDATNTVEISV